MIARRAIFTGRVQGVGFRATTRSIARRHPVTGFVRNLPDGSVELVASGDATDVDAFLSEVQSAFAGNVAGVEISDHDGPADFAGFSIRR